MDTGGVSSREVFAFVWRYWRQLPLRLAVILLGALTVVVLEIQIPAISSRLVMALERYGAGEAPLASARSAAGWLLATFAVVTLLRQLYMRMWMRFAAHVMRALVADGFYRLQRFSADWHANHFAGSTVRALSRGMWAYDTLADSLVIDLGPTLAILVGFAVAMALREPLLGAYFAAAVTVFLTVSIVLSLRYVAPANQASNDADTALNGALADAITANPVVKAFGAERREDERLGRIATLWRHRTRRSWQRSMDSGAVQSAMVLVLLGGLLAIILGRAAEGSASLDELVYVLTTYFIVNGYLRNIGWQVRNLQRALNELDDLVAIAQTPAQIADATDAAQLEPRQGAIRFESVRFGYANQPAPLFEGFDLEIAAGEKVALVGASGAGKTTLVKLLQRLYDLQAGCIRIDDQDIARVTQQSLREAVALVPQEPILFHRSLAENIAYARPGASLEQVVAAARQAHAHAFIENLDDGYGSLVGERGIKLSGGERQRIAIARAILADVPILILDEATSSLDSVTEHHIQAAIATLLEGRTAVLIAHRLSTIRRCDRILVFDQGRIVEQGSHEHLMADPAGVYRRLFDMQSLGFVDAAGERRERSTA